MEDNIEAIVSKATFAPLAVTLNLSFCRLLTMVLACARLAVSIASPHPGSHHFGLMETIICLVAGNIFFSSPL